MTKDELLDTLKKEEGITDPDELAEKILEDAYKQEREAGIVVSAPSKRPPRCNIY